MSDDSPPPPFVPDATLAAVPDGWWLELRCGCGRATFWPGRMLAGAFGAGASVPALLARLRCSACRGRPASACWMDNPAAAGPLTLHSAPRRVPLALPRP